ncbi:MAG: nucleotidyltransferase domain-containing protein [Ignavibacteriaceae bacterium]|nr:nucleotidyltransferase domain-containing protein [Ignavibacteriaceae bacterium]
MNQKLISDLTHYLTDCPDVSFAFIFGSFGTEKFNEYLSDIDLGVYFSQKPDLYRIGTIISELSAFTDLRIDFVQLNDLYKKDSLFAYQAVTSSRLLIAKDENTLTDFKKNTLLWYFDTEWLRNLTRTALEKRIDSGQFGMIKHG